MSTAQIFQDIDRMDAEAFASYLSEDCPLRFARRSSSACATG
jgi:hypothetical protein